EADAAHHFEQRKPCLTIDDDERAAAHDVAEVARAQHVLVIAAHAGPAAGKEALAREQRLPECRRKSDARGAGENDATGRTVVPLLEQVLDESPIRSEGGGSICQIG